MKKIFKRIIILLVLLINFSLIYAYADTNNIYNNEIYPKAAYKKGVEAPININKANKESINYATGNLDVITTDVSIKGKNGLDLTLGRYYSSSESNLKQNSAGGINRYAAVQLQEVRNYVDNYLFDKNDMLLKSYTSYTTVYVQNNNYDAIRGEFRNYWSNNGGQDVYHYSDGSYLISKSYNNDTYIVGGYFYEQCIISETWEGLSDVTVNETHSLIGTGWSFDLPYIDTLNGLYLHYGSSGVWRVNIGGGSDSHLVDYTLNDMRIDNDNGSYIDNYGASTYVLTLKDGKKTYFGLDGRLMKVVDRYGNKISYFNTIDIAHIPNYPVYPKVTKLSDDFGREINIDYSSNPVKVTVTDPTNSDNNKKIFYFLSEVPNMPNERVLSSVVDSENREIKYSYIYETAIESFLAKSVIYSLGNVVNTYAYLKEINNTSLNAKTVYNYESSIKNCGMSGFMQFFKVKERYDEQNNKRYNYKNIQYKYGGTGEYDGYDKYKFTDEDLPSYTFKARVSNDLNYSTVYTYTYIKDPVNSYQGHTIVKLLCTDALTEGSNSKKEISYEYDSKGNNAIKEITKTFNNQTGNALTNIENFEYNDFKDLTGYWDAKASRDANNIPIDNEHKTTYAYNGSYHYVINKSYKKDSNTTIAEVYTTTSDQKNIEWAKISENGVWKKQTQYVYDSFNNLTEERNYFNNGLDIWSVYTSTNYSYLDNDSTRSGRFNNLYLTRKWYTNINNVDNQLITPRTGNSPGIVDEQYFYDGFGLLTKTVNGKGGSTQYTYDKVERKKTQTNPDLTKRSWDYNDSENSVILTDENLNKFKYVYDLLGNLISEVDCATNQVLHQYTYDPEERIITDSTINSSQDGKKMEYDYYDDGRLKSKTVKNKLDTLLSSESYAYNDVDSTGLYSVITKTIVGESNSPSIIIKTYINKYGEIEKQGRMHNGSEYLNTYIYDYAKNKIQEKNVRATSENWSNCTYTTKYEYDFSGKVLNTYDALNNKISTKYDELGRVIQKIDPKANKSGTLFATQYRYDNMGRVLETKTPFIGSGSTITAYSIVQYIYDLNGNKIEERKLSNKAGQADRYDIIRYEYNIMDRLIKVTTTNNGIDENYTQYYYDSNGNVLRKYTGLSKPLTISGLDAEIANGDNKYSVTKYIYDRFDRITDETDPRGKIEKTSYDLNGAKVDKTDRNGNTISILYDGLGKMLSKVATITQTGAATTYNYSYYLTGNRKSMTQNGIMTSYLYDDLGRLIQEDSNNIRKKSEYDDADNRKGFSVFKIVNGSEVQQSKVSYDYDHLNRMEKVYKDNILTMSYQFDDNGNRLTDTNNTTGITTSYVYNLSNILTNMTNQKGSTVVSSFQYTHYLDGNIDTKSQTINSTSTLTSYQYDGLNRLTNVIEPTKTTSYQYDDNNNRHIMDTVENGITTSVNYDHDLNNRLSTEVKTDNNSTQTTIYGYDDNGNTLSKLIETQKTATGDPVKLGITIIGQNGDEISNNQEFNGYNGFNELILSQTGGHTISYAYDSDGLRVNKTVDGVAVNHIWDGNQIIANTDSSGSVTTKYTRGLNLILSTDGQDANSKHYLYNGHGDVVQLTDGTGNVVKSYDYDAFGNEKNPDPSDTNAFRYSGEYFDKETGVIYLRARYYDPSIGRFTTEDSYDGEANDPLSLNLYTYCQGDPINNWDPTGHKAGDIFKAQDAAAIDFAKIYATEKDSIKYNYEWHAYIYQMSDGKYSYTLPISNKGQQNNTGWRPPAYDGKYDQVSDIHTHGAYDKLSDLTFSDLDKFGCVLSPIYLANAAGEVLYYNPEGHGPFEPQMYLIAKGLPKQPNVIKGDSGYDPYIYDTIKYSYKNTWQFWNWGTIETISRGQKFNINRKTDVER